MITIFDIFEVQEEKVQVIMIVRCIQCILVEANLTRTQLRPCNMSNNFNIDKWLIWIMNLRVQNTRFETQKVPYINLFKGSFYHIEE